jgi:hypothetical protein
VAGVEPDTAGTIADRFTDRGSSAIARVPRVHRRLLARGYDQAVVRPEEPSAWGVAVECEGGAAPGAAAQSRSSRELSR